MLFEQNIAYFEPKSAGAFPENTNHNNAVMATAADPTISDL